MMCAYHVDQRSSPRAFVIFPISISPESGARPHTGIVRDISKEGIFFYSNYNPQLQQTISLVLHLNNVEIECTGKVVRVEQKAPGAAVGIAVKIEYSTAVPVKS
jgi:hypothetical protein